MTLRVGYKGQPEGTVPRVQKPGPMEGLLLLGGRAGRGRGRGELKKCSLCLQEGAKSKVE